jgi:hypothetical protein
VQRSDKYNGGKAQESDLNKKTLFDPQYNQQIGEKKSSGNIKVEPKQIGAGMPAK